MRFGMPHLVEFQFRTDDDDGAAGIIDALAEQVLAETALLTFQHVGERAERPALGGHLLRAEARRVVDQRIDGFLKHALLVADDDVRRFDLEAISSNDCCD